ncbi:hypothetical protein BKA66DRAFT_459465, partial [Pyrenochaeta sp. MPI-SDFR-AT-0127]
KNDIQLHGADRWTVKKMRWNKILIVVPHTVFRMVASGQAIASVSDTPDGHTGIQRGAQTVPMFVSIDVCLNFMLLAFL